MDFCLPFNSIRFGSIDCISTQDVSFHTKCTQTTALFWKDEHRVYNRHIGIIHNIDQRASLWCLLSIWCARFICSFHFSIDVFLFQCPLQVHSGGQIDRILLPPVDNYRCAVHTDGTAPTFERTRNARRANHWTAARTSTCSTPCRPYGCYIRHRYAKQTHLA